MHILKPTLRFSTRLLSTIAIVFAIFLSVVRLIPVLASSRTEPIQHYECEDTFWRICYIAWHPNKNWLTIRQLYAVQFARIVDADFVTEFFNEGSNVIEWTPDGRWLATIGIDDILIRDSTDGHVVHQGDYVDWFVDLNQRGLLSSSDIGNIEAMSWDPDGTRLAFNSGYYLAVWDNQSNTFELVNTPEDRYWEKDGPVDVDWSPDGNTIALATDAQLALIDSTTYNVLLRVDYPPQLTTEELYSSNILAWSPDGQWVAVAIHTSRYFQYDEPARVLLFDPETEEFERMLVSEAKFIRSVSWSPDGRWLATASVSPSNNQAGDTIYYENAVRIWDIQNNELAQLITFDSPVYMVDWSADGDYLATSTFSGDIDIWENDLD